MVEGKPSGRLGRRRILQAGAALGAVGAVQVTSPFIVKALGEVPIKFGYEDPLTGSLSIVAISEIQGAKLAVEEINKKGGIMGRQLVLYVEDSANDVGTGVEKERLLIDKYHCNITFGDVNSGIAYAVAQVATEKGVLHIVPGGHTDPITGKDCTWNVFRICNTTSMDANAISNILIKKYGKRWYFVTPDYAYGHTLQAAFIKDLKAAGGTYEYALLPIAASDFSATLIKAKAFKPNVLLNNMGGLAQIDLMKQFVEFGMEKEMGLGGALYEVEEIVAVPAAAQTGWWDMEWWWNQPGVPHVAEFVAAIKKKYNKIASARHWFGYVAMYSGKLAIEKAKSLKAIDLAHALAGMELPPEVALQPGKVFYRAGDHQLMPNIFAGEVHPPPANNPGNFFTVAEMVSAEKAWPLADTGCHMKYPA
ncbi:MAG: ABC transporter substrate-binding protein [Rhodospirillales bacterium]|nr:ABC transporter substrate-binding protein [Rhodospirillales bacterium]